jgi:hypothetical protein
MSRSTTGIAGGIVPLAGLAGTLVALANYFMPDNGISGTPGALLVIASSALLAVVGLALWRQTSRAGTPQRLLRFIALVLIAGTAWAAWLLEAPTLVAIMGVAALGWTMSLLQRSGP